MSSPTAPIPPHVLQLCTLPPVAERPLDPRLNPNRASLIRTIEKIWVNGTVIHFHFLEHNVAWRVAEKQKEVVRWAIGRWKAQGIGLTFREVQHTEHAEVRIGFEAGAGSWSFVGRDCIDQAPAPKERTTNY